MITAQMVKELRDITQAGMMDCKKALKECEGDMEKAKDYLRKKGLAQAAKRADREAKEGLIESYIHPGAKVGVLLEINCETDFVARTEEFKNLAHNISMQIAAESPQYVSIEEIPEEFLNKEKNFYIEQMKETGKPENIIEKIVEGKLSKLYKETVLLEQSYVKDDSRTVKDIITETAAKVGENIKIKRFSRFSLGEK